MPRAALAAPCKADGEVCQTSRSCCGTRGNNGVCVKGRSAKFGVCCTPSAEVCDGRDNDCNGLVDDGSAQTSGMDANACTIHEACTGGVCVSAPLDCNDDDACTTDTCDSATGCVHTPVDCDDHDACTADTCDSVAGCVVIGVLICNDHNACTTDTCDSATGCVYTPVTCAAGEHCGVTGECVPDTACPCFDAANIDLIVRTCGAPEQCGDGPTYTYLGCSSTSAEADTETSGFALHYCALNHRIIQPISTTQRDACLALIRQGMAGPGVCGP